MAIVDDSKLIELSAEPVRCLFPVLHRVSALTPLVVLLAFLPGLYAIQYDTLCRSDAAWGLKSLAILSALDWETVLDPADQDGRLPFQWYAPLGSWLMALCQGVFGTSWVAGLSLTSYLSVAGLIGMAFVLWRRLADARIAFLGILLLAVHANLLALIQNPAPHALAILGALIAFWGYLSHLRGESEVFPQKLLSGGFGLGVCLLAGGPFALLVITILAGHSFGVSRRTMPASGRRRNGRRKVKTDQSPSRSLVLLILIGLLIGGWWEVLLGMKHGWPFWKSWLTGAMYSDPARAFGQPISLQRLQFAFESLLATLGFLIGLSCYGIWCACREAFSSTETRMRDGLRFLIIWLCLSLFVWLVLSVTQWSGPSLQELFRQFFAISLVAFAAFTINEISERRVSLSTVVGLVAVTLVTLNRTFFFEELRQPELTANLVFWIMAGLLLVIAIAVLCRHCTSRDRRQQLLLSTLTVALILSNALGGFGSARQWTENDRELLRLRRQLSGMKELQDNPERVRKCTLITESNCPDHLRYILRSVWPHIPLEIVDHWDTALSQTSTLPTQSSKLHVVVTWGVADANLRNIGLNLTPLTSPQFYRHRQLRAYSLINQPSRPSDVGS